MKWEKHKYLKNYGIVAPVFIHIHKIGILVNQLDLFLIVVMDMLFKWNKSNDNDEKSTIQIKKIYKK